MRTCLKAILMDRSGSLRVRVSLKASAPQKALYATKSAPSPKASPRRTSESLLSCPHLMETRICTCPLWEWAPTWVSQTTRTTSISMWRWSTCWKARRSMLSILPLTTGARKLKELSVPCSIHWSTILMSRFREMRFSSPQRMVTSPMTLTPVCQELSS